MEGPSTVNWVAVAACTVVINPSSIPKLSSRTFAIGARQLVVHDALDTIISEDFASLWLTPITNIGASWLGADITTFLAPEFIWDDAFSIEVKIPVHSATISTPISDQLISFGSLSAVIFMGFPLITNLFSLTSTDPSKGPWTESYFRR